MIPVIDIDQNAAVLIGFAIKARQIVRGFQGVSRAVIRNRLVLILVEGHVTRNTLKKMEKIQKQYPVLIIQTGPDTDWVRLWGMESQKIFGILNGDIGRKIIQKFKAGV